MSAVTLHELQRAGIEAAAIGGKLRLSAPVGKLSATMRERIKAQIAAHTGIPAKPNMTLLGKVGENTQCDFTSAEAYRAAWGDKPLPEDKRRDRRSKDHDD